MENGMAAKDAIKRARIKLRLNQTEFAKELELHKATISMYEKGTRKPSFKSIREILKKLEKLGIKMDFEEFLDEDEL